MLPPRPPLLFSRIPAAPPTPLTLSLNTTSPSPHSPASPCIPHQDTVFLGTGELRLVHVSVAVGLVVGRERAALELAQLAQRPRLDQHVVERFGLVERAVEDVRRLGVVHDRLAHHVSGQAAAGLRAASRRGGSEPRDGGSRLKGDGLENADGRLRGKVRLSGVLTIEFPMFAVRTPVR